MKRFTLAVILTLLAAACGTTDTGAFDPNAAFSQGADGELRALAYGYQPDSSLTYGYTMDMDAAIMADIDGPDGFEEMTMGMALAGAISYDVSAGPQEGTVRLDIESTLSDFSLSDLTVDGEPMPADLLGADDPDLLGAGEFIPSMSVVLDSHGDVIEMQVGDVAVPTELLNAFGGGGFGDPTGMGMAGSLFGPELPFDEVRVGATWTTTDTLDVPFFGEMTVVTNHEIVGEESVAGRDTIVIKSVSQMPPMSMTLGEMLKAFQDPATMSALGMAGEDVDAALLEADLFEMMDFDFSMDIAYDEVVTTTWLDYEAGLMVASDGDIAMTMGIAIDAPDGGGDMTMEVSMSLGMLLTSDGAAV